MAKKNSSGRAGGVLLFLGSLVYLYVLFSWYMSSRGALTGWLVSATFLGPLIAAAFVVASISLLFMSFGAMAGRMGDKMMGSVLWKLIMVDAIAAVIATAGGAWFWAAILGFILTYVGAAMATM